MGVVVCERRAAVKGYYISSLDISIYTIEELCYLIYSNPILVMQDFLNEKLFDFISDFLMNKELAVYLHRMYKENKNNDELLVYILEKSSLYAREEVARYKNELLKYRKLTKGEFLKLQADYMFSIKNYFKAISLYEKIFSLPKDKSINLKFLASIYNNIGSAYAALFNFDKAYMNYSLAYECIPEKNILKKMYFLTKFDISIKEDMSPFLSDMDVIKFDEEYEAIYKSSLDSEAILCLNRSLEFDSIKRNKILKDYIFKIKREYKKIVQD